MKNNFYHPDFKIGVLGGGQLGRMFIQEAINWNVGIHCLDSDRNAPCKDLATTMTFGSLMDPEAVYQFGKDKDVVTIEIEHVSIPGLQRLEADGIAVYPSSALLETIQDKGLQKEFYLKHGIPTSPFSTLNSGLDLQQSDLPCVLKMRKGGYDGKGVQIIKNLADIDPAFNTPCIKEELVSFEKEISVIVARNAAGQVKSYPVVDMEFNDEANLVEFLFSPSKLADSIRQEAREIAEKVATEMNLVGILAVEMFLLQNGELLVNEAAPRPHNSGHQTIEGNTTSQYQQLLRALLNLELGDTKITQPSVMVNILGEANHTGDAHYQGIQELIATPDVFIHLYGKKETKPFRKMGHFTVLNPELEEAKKIASQLKNTLKVITK